MKPSLITLDVGGTLLYPYPSVGEIYSEVMGEFGILHSAEELEAGFKVVWGEVQDRPLATSAHDEKLFWYRVVKRVLQRLSNPNNFDDMFETLWVSFADPKRWHLYDGVYDTLLWLKERGYKLAILSNWDERLRPLLDGFELSPMMDGIYISSEVGHAKPSLDIFKRVENDLGVSGNQICHIGDSQVHDIDPAKSLGWDAVLIHHYGDKTDDSALHSFTDVKRLFS